LPTIGKADASARRGRSGKLTGNSLLQSDVWRMIRRRALAAGIQTEIGCHTFRATVRLSKRYARLATAGKDQRKIVTAVGRELLGFIWAIGVKAETRVNQQIAA
jgi:integrase